MTKTHWKIPGLLAVGLSASLAQAELPAALDPAAWDRQVCSTCHGLGGGTSSGQFPRLAGQSEAYLASQLRAYQDHGRSNLNAERFMWGVASWLSPAAIDALASYYAKLSPASPGPAPASAAEKALYEHGKRLYAQGDAARGLLACASCHGAEAQGLGPIPRLAGQNARYVELQLAVFKGHARADGAAMETEAQALSASDVSAVALYLQAR